MAPRTEQNERDFQTDINAAIAGTEDEIFRDAMSDDYDDNDGDTSLEDMGDGLEGDHLDEEDINVEEDVGPEGDDAAGDEDVEGDEEGQEDENPDDLEEGEEEGEGEPEPDPRTQRGQDQRREPHVPPGRLREANERARAAEQRYETLEARFNDLMTAVNSLRQPQQQTTQQQAPQNQRTANEPPDMFTDPDGYREWHLEQGRQEARRVAQEIIAERDRQQQEREVNRVNASFETASRGPRSFEFQPAYNALTSLDPRDPQAQALVRSIWSAPDPQQALFDWWDENGGPEFRDSIAQQLGLQPQPQRRPQGRQQGYSDQQPRRAAQPRMEFRGPRPMRSLNGASGSGSAQRVQDPEMFDNSESSVFEYATRR